MEAIAHALGVAPSHVASLVSQQPALAAVPLPDLEASVEALAARLALPQRQALVMVARRVELVGANPEEVLVQAETLGAALGLSTEQVGFGGAGTRQRGGAEASGMRCWRVAMRGQRRQACVGWRPHVTGGMQTPC